MLQNPCIQRKFCLYVQGNSCSWLTSDYHNFLGKKTGKGINLGGKGLVGVDKRVEGVMRRGVEGN